MISLRTFTEQGINEFEEYVQRLKLDPLTPRLDLNEQPYSGEFEPRVDIDEHMIFSTRMELGRYLTEALSSAKVSRNDVLGKHALWSWLAYIWLDQLCPLVSGKRKVLETARYVCSTDYSDFYRHFVAAPYDIYSRHGEHNSRIFLSSPVSIHNDFVEQIGSRQDYISNSSLIEALHVLYWNDDSKTPRRGAQTHSNPGGLRRFVSIMRQLELTYDIFTISVDKILELLPEEFDSWRNPEG
jgi:hypothetical protein